MRTNVPLNEMIVMFRLRRIALRRVLDVLQRDARIKVIQKPFGLAHTVTSQDYQFADRMNVNSHQNTGFPSKGLRPGL